MNQVKTNFHITYHLNWNIVIYSHLFAHAGLNASVNLKRWWDEVKDETAFRYGQAEIEPRFTGLWVTALSVRQWKHLQTGTLWPHWQKNRPTFFWSLNPLPLRNHYIIESIAVDIWEFHPSTFPRRHFFWFYPPSPQHALITELQVTVTKWLSCPTTPWISMYNCFVNKH